MLAKCPARKVSEMLFFLASPDGSLSFPLHNHCVNRSKTVSRSPSALHLDRLSVRCQAASSWALVSRALKNYDSPNTGGRMSQTPLTRELRRSTRVPLKVVIKAQSLTEPLTCEGETIVVNRHGALISSGVPLRVGMEIEIHVIMTDKGAPAKVVYADPERPRVCGIGLAEPENIWGVSFPPDDWYEDTDES
jgi:hypothetical protein